MIDGGSRSTRDGAPAWPRTLLLVRHGESAGNVARDLAEAAGHERIDIDDRDMDVGLSPNGERQAEALGAWLRDRSDDAPTVVLSSPYTRARRTAELAIGEAGLDTELILDERLREREFGVLDRLTRRGIETQFPDEAAARTRIGKFYHRPPGGESWCDVGLRVRSALDSISREHQGERVMLVAHQVVIFMFRYVIEHLDEAQILEISRQEELVNCSVTTFACGTDTSSGMELVRFNETVALERAGAPATTEDDPAPGGRA
ncbi:histidine phosphatase family protein [Aquihabitans daechungensis]|uniref:histidine phosphatase family protein n=1 Tax=Aquihabitans daechungensis TaxID=1052257 RepID=UPI003BA24D60